MKFWKAFIVFLIINFGALGIARWMMGNGSETQWHLALNRAPWTPEAWTIPLAWFSVMICFSVYMAFLINKRTTKKVIVLFILQFLLVISYSSLFFNLHMISLSLGSIIILTLIITAFFITYLKDLKWKSLFILPYIIWLVIATSLNLYTFINN